MVKEQYGDWAVGCTKQNSLKGIYIMSKTFKMMLSLSVAAGVLAFAAQGANAADAHVETKTTKTVVATDAKTGEVLNSAPGDVKTSNDDSGMNHDDAAHDKTHIEGDATPGDVKTSNDDSGMKHDQAPHDKVLENGEPAKK